jgi:serine/threonine protein phosphatase PrpC
MWGVRVPAPVVSFGTCTDVGAVREVNEDCAALVELRVHGGESVERVVLAVVADGMGGHAAGEVASRKAVDVVTKTMAFRCAGIGLSERRKAAALGEAFERANASVYELAKSDASKAGMGTTLTAALLIGSKLYVAHVGDTRAYVVRGRSIERITKDHSVVQQKLDAGLMTPDEAARSEERSQLHRVVGVRPTVSPDFLEESLEPGDHVLLCTDGLHGALRDDQIARVVRRSGLAQQACRSLVELARRRDGSDNVTAVCIGVGTGLLSSATVSRRSRRRARARRMLLKWALAVVMGAILTVAYLLVKQLWPPAKEAEKAAAGASKKER